MHLQPCSAYSASAQPSLPAPPPFLGIHRRSAIADDLLYLRASRSPRNGEKEAPLRLPAICANTTGRRATRQEWCQAAAQLLRQSEASCRHRRGSQAATTRVFRNGVRLDSSSRLEVVIQVRQPVSFVPRSDQRSKDRRELDNCKH